MFRKNLVAAYEGRCAVTQTNVADILEAAHIVPYDGASTNDVRNGLLLRSDIHALFDLGLISIDPTDLRIHCSQEIRSEPIYNNLQGRQLWIPKNREQQPSGRALRQHFEARIP